MPSDDVITETEITTYVNDMAGKSDFTDPEKAREAINLQAWILHLMNPAEGWANLRRSDYPVLPDRTDTKRFPRFTSDFTYDDDNLTTPVRLCYPILEEKYNKENYQEALDRMGISYQIKERIKTGITASGGTRILFTWSNSFYLKND